MRLRSKILLPVIGITLAVSAIGLLAVDASVSGLIDHSTKQARTLSDESIQSIVRERAQAYNGSVNETAQAALELASLFSRQSQVIQAYELADQGDIDQPDDPTVQQARQQMRAALGPVVDAYKKYADAGEFKLHFHLPNGRSLVRMWRDGWNAKVDGKQVDVSDDISSFRATVMQINQGDHAALKGIEVGRGGFAIRGLAPVTGPDGQHLGSVEVLKPFDRAIKVLRTSDDQQFAVYMDRELLDIATKLQDPAKYPILDDAYVRCSVTDEALMDPLVTTELLDAGSKDLTSETQGKWRISAWPVHDFAGKTIGVMVMAMDLSRQMELIDGIAKDGQSTQRAMFLKAGVGVAVMCGVILLVLATLTERCVLKPTRGMTRRLRDIAEGDGDLTQRIASNCKDEFCELAEAFNRFLDNIHDMVVQVVGVTNEVAGATTQIAANAEEMSASADEQDTQAQRVAGDLKQVIEVMNRVAQRSDEARNDADKTRNVAREGDEAVTGIVNQMQTIRTTVNQSVRLVDQLGERGKEIGEIVNTINDIADQTNLLALNAAIEAARAGEHGRGFAVVADEVRKLADRTIAATEQITESVTTIQRDTSNAVEQIRGNEATVQEGETAAQRASDGLQGIVGSVQGMTSVVEEIATATRDQTEHIGEVGNEMQRMRESIREVSSAVGQSAEAASSLSERAETLRAMVSRFKVANHLMGEPEHRAA